MQIHGVDLEFKTTYPIDEALNRAVNAILVIWPEAIVDVEHQFNRNVHTAILKKGESLGPLTTDVFIHPNEEMYHLWNKEGWTKKSAHGLIHLHKCADSLLCVLEDPEDSRLKPIVEAIQAALLESEARVENRKHIAQVQVFLGQVCDQLKKRGEEHDASKLEPPEAGMFDLYTSRLKGLTYGSDEYRECLRGLGPALSHHYSVNKHHPQHWGDDWMNKMTIIDFLELLADWKAAGMRHADGSMVKSFEINRGRFEMDKHPEVTSLLVRTAEELGWL